MSGLKLYMMVEDRGRDELSAQNMMRKHETKEASVDNFAATMWQLGETACRLNAREHPDSKAIYIGIGQVDKLYACLKDLTAERRARLDEALRWFLLNREEDSLNDAWAD